MTLFAGTAKINITPDQPIELAGYGSRVGVFEGVNHPIFCRVVVFRQQQPNGSQKQILLASADLVWWPVERMDAIREQLKQRFQIEGDDIILNATHTHSGPQTTKVNMPILGVQDEAYVAFLEQCLMTAVEQAIANMEPVRLEKAIGECTIGTYRRKWSNGQMVMLPNPEGPSDPELTIIRIVTEQGELKSLLTHYTCHPTTTDENMISSEFCGVALGRLEEEIGGVATALFLQGCCGDVRPPIIRDGKFYNGKNEDVLKLAERFLGNVKETLAKSFHPLQETAIGGQRSEVALPFAHVPSISELQALLVDGNHIEKLWAEHMLANPELVKDAATLELVRLDLAEGLSLLSMNAEMVLAYGLFTKETTEGQVLPVAYSNGVIGYVSTSKQLEEGGYEATDSYCYFGLCSPFVREAEAKIREEIQSLVEERG